MMKSAKALILAGDHAHNAEDAFEGVGSMLKEEGMEVQCTVDFAALGEDMLADKDLFVILRDGIEFPNGRKAESVPWMQPAESAALPDPLPVQPMPRVPEADLHQPPGAQPQYPPRARLGELPVLALQGRWTAPGKAAQGAQATGAAVGGAGGDIGEEREGSDRRSSHASSVPLIP